MTAIPEESRKYLEVLLVEDNPGYVRLTREAFRDANTAMRLHVTSDGAEALAFLHREGVHADAPRPDIILLDLTLPKVDGREVLAHIKQDHSLKSIPTAILSGSDAPADIARSYSSHANCYLVKPAQWDAFLALMNSVNDFWLQKVKLPSRMDASDLIELPDLESSKKSG